MKMNNTLTTTTGTSDCEFRLTWPLSSAQHIGMCLLPGFRCRQLLFRRRSGHRRGLDVHAVAHRQCARMLKVDSPGRGRAACREQHADAVALALDLILPLDCWCSATRQTCCRSSGRPRAQYLRFHPTLHSPGRPGYMYMSMYAKHHVGTVFL